MQSLRDENLRIASHVPVVPYNNQMDEYIIAMGFYQIANNGYCKIDPGFISALVERWRPETNTFHMPWGEITITLEDVACLWGLPITGKLYLLISKMSLSL